MKRFTYGVVGGYVSNRFYNTERGAKNAATREHGNSVNLQVGYISKVSGMFIPVAQRGMYCINWMPM